MIKSKATKALELLDQFRWIFQEVTNNNADVIASMQQRIETLEASVQQIHRVLGEIVNILEKREQDANES